MTDEIIKLYKNAGIEPTYTDECQIADSYYCMAKDLNERGILFDDYMNQQYPNKNEMCYETCPYAYNKEFYPPFTAEKQIEIVKRILSSTWWINLKRLQFAENFENSLAELVNDLWHDLTEQEKEQIRGILKEGEEE